MQRNTTSVNFSSHVSYSALICSKLNGFYFDHRFSEHIYIFYSKSGKKRNLLLVSAIYTEKLN
jgi:hypothetical protein